jgi:hypothetical protein
MSLQAVVDDLNRRTTAKVNRLNAQSEDLKTKTQGLYVRAERCAVDSDKAENQMLTACAMDACENDRSAMLTMQIAELESKLEVRKRFSRSKQFVSLVQSNPPVMKSGYYSNFATGEPCSSRTMKCTWDGTPVAQMSRDLDGSYFDSPSAKLTCELTTEEGQLAIVPDSRLLAHRDESQVPAMSWTEALEDYGNSKIFAALVQGACIED